MTTAEDNLFGAVRKVFIDAMGLSVPMVSGVIWNDFILPEIANRNRRGEELKPEEVWLFQIIFYPNERPTTIRLNGEFVGDIRVGAKKFHNRNIGEVSQNDIKTLDLDNLWKLTTRDDEAGVSNITFIWKDDAWKCGEFDLNQLLRFPSIYVVKRGRGEFCQEDECQILIPPQRTKYCSKACERRQTKRNQRRKNKPKA